MVLGCQHQNVCAGWHTVAIVPGGFTGQALSSGTMSLTVGQTSAGLHPGDEISIHVGVGPISTVE